MFLKECPSFVMMSKTASAGEMRLQRLAIRQVVLTLISITVPIELLVHSALTNLHFVTGKPIARMDRTRTKMSVTPERNAMYRGVASNNYPNYDLISKLKNSN